MADDKESPEARAESGAILTPTFAFGPCGVTHGKVIHVEENRVLFLAGRHVASYDLVSKEMSFLLVHERVASVRGYALSPNKKYVAVIETVMDSDRDQFSVFNLQTERRVKTIPLEVAGVEIKGLVFSENSKLIVALCGGPDHMLYCWRWYGAKQVASAPCGYDADSLSFNPLDHTQLATCGRAALRTWQLDDEAQTLVGGAMVSQEGEGEFTAHTWLQGALLAACTTRGSVCIFQDVVQKATLSTGQHDYLRTIATLGRGFVTAGLKGVVSFFTPVEVQERHSTQEKAFQLQKQLSPDGLPQPMLHLSVSPTETNLLVSTDANELHCMSLDADSAVPGADGAAEGAADEEGAASPLKPLFVGFHQGRVRGMDVISHQPFVATVGEDRVLRVVDYQRKTMVLQQTLTDDPLSVALHPSGFMLLIGYSDRLRLYYLVKGELLELAEFGLKKCSKVIFSHGGQAFAAVGASNLISIFNTFTYKQLASLKGHVSSVTSICWSEDDSRLASVGSGGACYQWDVGHACRIPEEEYVDKRQHYSFVRMSSAAGAAVTRTLDGKIQQIRGGAVECEVQGTPGAAYPIALVGGDSVLLAATSTGSIRTYSWPPSPTSPKGTHDEIQLHGRSITHMCVTHDQGTLFTVSEDGVLMMSSTKLVIDGILRDVEVKRDFPQICLIQNAQMQALHERAHELKGQLKALKSDMEYQRIMATKILQEQLREANARADSLQTNVMARNAEIVSLKETFAEERHRLVEEMEASHVTAAERLEMAYERRLLAEQERCKAIEAAKDDLQFSCDERIKKLDAAHAQILRDALVAYDKKLEEAEAKQSEIAEARETIERDYREVLQQYDLEFDDQTDKMQHKMLMEREAAETREVKLKGKNHILKTGHYRLKNEKKADIKALTELQEKCAALETRVQDYELTVTAMRADIAEREDVIGQNYQTIQQLRRRVGDLEKHKFVLGYRSQELQQELEPKDAEILQLSGQLQQHDEELVEEVKRAEILQRAIEARDLRISALKKDAENLRMHIAKYERQTANLTYEMGELLAMPDGRRSDKRRAMEKIYTKYCTGETSVNEHHAAVEKEVGRQRDTVEIKNDILKRRLSLADADKRNALRDRTSENSMLLKELSDMKRENKELERALAHTRSHLHDIKLNYDKLQHQASSLQHQSQENSAPHTQGPYPAPPGTAPGHRAVTGMASTQSNPPTRPVTAWGPAAGRPPSPGSRPQTANSRPQTAGSSRPRTAESRPQTAEGLLSPSRPGGGVMKGSPVRVLNELVGAERERIVKLMGALAANSDMVEHQRREINALKTALQDQLTIDEEDEEAYNAEPADTIHSASLQSNPSAAARPASLQEAQLQQLPEALQKRLSQRSSSPPPARADDKQPAAPLPRSASAHPASPQNMPSSAASPQVPRPGSAGPLAVNAEQPKAAAAPSFSSPARQASLQQPIVRAHSAPSTDQSRQAAAREGGQAVVAGKPVPVPPASPGPGAVVSPYTMRAFKGAAKSRPPSAGGIGAYYANRDRYLADYGRGF
ncbi:hypothetical protein WJX72_000711 [[Myrmecia] bisecta]|uniref:Uncharacterized protein n=1 Tax=[Myrmecia] bisecta TaxID=41462 RepID=A0AAW1Q6E6_9CHLO